MKINENLKQELIDLLNTWDPIDVYPSLGGPKDEYNCFIPLIIEELEAGTSKEELQLSLNKFLSNHVGVDADEDSLNNFANQVLEWWDKTS